MDTTLREELDELKQQSPLFYEWVVSRSNLDSDTKALAVIKRGQSWFQMLSEKERLQELAARLRNDRVTQAMQMLEQAATKAARTMLELTESPDDRVRYQASKDILDRLGAKVPDKLQVDVQHSISARTIDDVLLQVYGERLEAKRLAAGEDVIEGEFKQDSESGQD